MGWLGPGPSFSPMKLCVERPGRRGEEVKSIVGTT